MRITNNSRKLKTKYFQVSAIGFDCHNSPNNVDPDECCKTPMMIPMEILTDCLTKYGNMRKRQLDLPGPRRGCVN